MSRYYSYISSASEIVKAYKGEQPFVHFIKKHFAAHKKFGSKDRKIISGLCYSYFRIFHAFKGEDTQEKIVKGVFLCESKSNVLLSELHPELNNNIEMGIEEKCRFLNLDPLAVFPFSVHLGEEIDRENFGLSFLLQPLLFLRLRPGKKRSVLEKLKAASIKFDYLSDDCIALQNATSLQNILRVNKEAVVQDFNSQQVFNYPENIALLSSKQQKLTVWDCCAASGGKSILLYDRMAGNIELTVSDIRKNILHNLQERLQEAVVPVYKTFATDLLVAIPEMEQDKFDIIICDVPCTGSGTWSRTPEQAAFFKTASIAEYALGQQKIAGNAARLLKKKGLFFYITCSVFKKENESIVQILQEQHSLVLLQQQYLKGYEMQADTLFVAVLQR
ncbi:MAG: methyltransferase domain-containing protein [Gloeobacteraceae cyanobacterium ES-bin-316]|nr:methyltransferase domain-containing protein [Ferruginibacter sp.]